MKSVTSVQPSNKTARTTLLLTQIDQTKCMNQPVISFVGKSVIEVPSQVPDVDPPQPIL